MFRVSETHGLCGGFHFQEIMKSRVRGWKWRNRVAVVVLVIGGSRMAGDVTGWRWLHGVGLASGVAPYPRVFTDVDGYEAFAARFILEGRRADGSVWSRALDPEWYADLKGPYNRRNVYGAALAFAPRLPEELRDAVLHEALSEGSALRGELGVPEDVRELRVRIEPREGATNGLWIFPESES